VTEASFLAAFAGGVLSLLAPCSALLLPAFFANAFTSPAALLGRTLLFLAGLSTVFVPLGLGASLVGALLIDHRETTIQVAGLLLIGFGALELVGAGFSLVPSRFAARFQGGKSGAAIYGTGVVYGISGFCAGPLLGAVLTIAGSAESPLLGGAVLFVYALGTAAPLFLIAWLWDRYRLGRRAWLRGRPLRLGPVEIHSTRLVSGLLFVALGATFIWFQGSSGLSVLYADLGLDELGFRAQAWVEANAVRVPGGLWVVGLVLLGAGTLWRLRRRSAVGAPTSGPGTPRAAAAASAPGSPRR
jgi:cytochrome c biogenesis protein CcdA